MDISMSMNYGGSVLYTVPMNGSGNSAVSKSGENELDIDGAWSGQRGSTSMSGTLTGTAITTFTKQ